MQGYKTVRKIRTLEEACPAETRPKCGNCGKRLRPKTELLFICEGDSPPETPPDGGELKHNKLSNSPNKYKAVLGVYSYSYSWGDKPTEYSAHVWTGEFVGYSRHYRGEPLFCTQACAATFGCLCYEAGHRRKGLNT